MIEVRTTGVGSLPQDDPVAAVQHVANYYDYAFFPQVAALERDVPGASPMLREMLTPPLARAFMVRCPVEFETALRQCADRPDMAAACVRACPAYAAIKKTPLKLQVAGPHTFTASVVGAIPTLDYAKTLSLAWRWTETLTHAWLAAFPAKIIVWDDALLPVRATPGELTTLRRIAGELSQRGARLGLHSCASGSIEQMTEALPGLVLSLDLSVMDLYSHPAFAAAKRHMGRGGGFIFGVVDTRGPPFPSLGDDHLARLADLAPSHGPLLISGGCGTGCWRPEDEVTVATKLRQCAKIICGRS